MPAALHRELPLSIPGIAEGQAALRRFLHDAGLAEQVIYRAELVLEEALMNVLMHGFATPEGQSVHLAASLEPAGCRMVLEDAGKPFDPTAAEPPAPATRLGDARIGGLGLTLLRRFARDFAYERLAEGRNRLALTVPLEEAG